MSISYNLYNAEPQFAEMWKWESDHYLPVGDITDVIDRINNLFKPRELSWEVYDFDDKDLFSASHSALARNWNWSAGEEYIDLSVLTNLKGYVCQISARKGSPLLLQTLIKEFNLQYVCELSSCTLIDPFKYNGNWELIENDNY